MTTISNSMTFTATTTLTEANQKILASLEQELKNQGVEGKIDQDALVLKTVAHDDGSFTVTYQYPLVLDEPAPLPDGSTQRASNALNNLGEQGFVDLGQILALFHQVAQEQRNSAQEGRQAQLNVQVAELKNAAQDIRDSAVAAFVGAMIMGGLSIAGGILSTIGSVKGGLDASKGLAKSQEATQLGNKLAGKEASPGEGIELLSTSERSGISAQIKGLNAQSSSFNALSQSTVGKWQGFASMASGVGGVGKGIADYIAADQQADSKEDEARATKAGAQRDELIDYQSRMQQMMGDVRQMLQQISQNQMETARAILRV
ncbi:MAG: hypothetical protein QG599_2799 [Pseudomonadota bacterium]|nr:hypothetical protein [Pseudomonadota bacterium]